MSAQQVIVELVALSPCTSLVILDITNQLLFLLAPVAALLTLTTYITIRRMYYNAAFAAPFLFFWLVFLVCQRRGNELIQDGNSFTANK